MSLTKEQIGIIKNYYYLESPDAIESQKLDELCNLALKGLELAAALKRERALRGKFKTLEECLKPFVAETPALWGDIVEDGVARHYFREDSINGVHEAYNRIENALAASDKGE